MINWLDDVGAPAVVTAANIGFRASSVRVFGQPVADMLPYVLTAGGYLAAYKVQ
jgi:hypothetical protein